MVHARCSVGIASMYGQAPGHHRGMMVVNVVKLLMVVMVGEVVMVLKVFLFQVKFLLLLLPCSNGVFFLLFHTSVISIAHRHSSMVSIITAIARCHDP